MLQQINVVSLLNRNDKTGIMKRTRIGKGYWRGFKKNPIIYLIQGKAYAKDKRGWAYMHTPCDIEGYVPVNIDHVYKTFHKMCAGEKHNDWV